MRVGFFVVAVALGALGCDKKESAPGPDSDQLAAQAKAAAAAAKKAAAATVKKKAATPVPALHHLPGDCLAVVSVDFKAVFEDPAVKKHVLTPLDQNLERVRTKPDEDEKELKQALDLLGVESMTALHSLALCAGQVDFQTGKPEAFAMVIGGQFELNDELTSTVTKFVDKDGKSLTKVTVAGIPALKDEKEGVVLAQLPSGALAFANDEKMLSSIVKPKDDYKKYQLPAEHQLTMVVSDKLSSEALRKGGAGSPLAGLKPGVFSLSGSVNGKFSGEVGMGTDEEATKAAAALGALLQQMARDPAAQAATQGVKLEAKGRDLHVTMEFPPEMVEAAIADWGKNLAAQVSKKGP